MSAAGDKILGSIREARAVLRGEVSGEFVVHVPRDFDVKALRRKLGMSQSKFAASFGFGLDAVQSWEQGRRRPEGPARVLLKVIDHDPDAVRRALAHSDGRARAGSGADD
jgi:putative transcriptional regulator